MATGRVPASVPHLWNKSYWVREAKEASGRQLPPKEQAKINTAFLGICEIRVTVQAVTGRGWCFPSYPCITPIWSAKMPDRS